MKIVTKNVPTKFIESEFGTFAVLDVIEILSGLEGSCYGSGIVISGSGVEDLLLDAEVITKTTRGHVYTRHEQNRVNMFKYLCKALRDE